jgi:hypothetical protein
LPWLDAIRGAIEVEDALGARSSLVDLSRS